jgi:hypothetical protein
VNAFPIHNLCVSVGGEREKGFEEVETFSYVKLLHTHRKIIKSRFSKKFLRFYKIGREASERKCLTEIFMDYFFVSATFKEKGDRSLRNCFIWTFYDFILHIHKS